METSIAIRQTVGQMVAAYLEANEEIRQAYALLDHAQQRLDAAFGDDHRRMHVLPEKYATRHQYTPPKDLSGVLTECAITRANIKADAWANIMGRLEVRSTMSTARAKELDAQLDQPDKLPDITEESVFGLVDNMMTSLGGYMEEAVKEVFDMLRPRSGKYKTNSLFEVGERVILQAFYGSNYWGRPKIDHSLIQQFRNLDNVFHLLDAKGPVKSYSGPFVAAIESLSRYGDTGKTDYFEFKPCKNGNVHIKFLRMDLVDKLNQIAGGNMLKTA